jgi:thiol:disulfide interchange protein
MNYLLRVFLLSLSVFFISDLHAQDSTASPFKWKAESKKIGERKYELSFSTEGAKGWQLYSPVQTLADLDKTTELLFNDSAIRLQANISEATPSKSINSAIFENKQVKVFDGPAIIKAIIVFDSIVPANLQGVLNYTYGNDTTFNAAIAFPFTVALEGGVAAATRIKVASIDIENPVNNCGDEGTKNKSILTIFLLGFLGGFIALLTPCVFPLIPVTVTFFTKKSPNKKKGMSNAILYGLFIFLIYVAITIPFHLTGSAKSEVFNNISTNVWLNLLFFVIFVIFAFSFFGFYEIGLPSSLANKADSKSGAGNLLGIFFMAATLTIVSFSCTGPILGTLLAGVADGGAWPLTAGAAGFGLALGLPFALFAMFPNWLQSLPKSGGWMTTVKVVLGFVELALAVKFLANADNVEQWGIIKREVFVALWVLIGLSIVLYLSGIIRFGHDASVKKFSKIRIAFITIFAAITIYLIPGLFNSTWANLKLLSGFPPPLSYSIYPHHVLHAKGVKPIVNDYEAALKKAKAENKPVLIDFTGWACVNCRRMEEKVWTNNEVDSLMRKEFVVISLYVDERTKLPLKDQITYTTSAGNEESIVTIGDKWTAFQKENFKAVSQPQYIIISPYEKALTKSKFYTPNPGEFADWLKCGLDAYRKK